MKKLIIKYIKEDDKAVYFNIIEKELGLVSRVKIISNKRLGAIMDELTNEIIETEEESVMVEFNTDNLKESERA